MASAAVHSVAVVLLLLALCLLLLSLWESVIVLCFVVHYFISILVLQSSWWGRESWLLYLICLPGVSWWLSGSFSRCHGVVCSLWLWYFLIILTYYFWNESLNAWRFANKLFNQTVMGKQVFVNTSYLQSVMKTNTCQRGKKKLDCIMSLNLQYLKKKKSKKKSTFVSSKMISHTFSSFI